MSDADFNDGRSRCLTPERRASLRRQAAQLAVQLPEDRLSALYVLESTRVILLNFFEREVEPSAPPLRLVGSDDA